MSYFRYLCFLVGPFKAIFGKLMNKTNNTNILLKYIIGWNIEYKFSTQIWPFKCCYTRCLPHYIINHAQIKIKSSFPSHILLCFWFVFLRLVYPMLPVSLDCPFLIAVRYSLTFICFLNYNITFVLMYPTNNLIAFIFLNNSSYFYNWRQFTSFFLSFDTKDCDLLHFFNIKWLIILVENHF
jgi:hypothetical protein